MTWTDGRVGRNRGLAPVELDTDGTTDGILSAVEREARKHLASRGVEADYHPGDRRGWVTAGGRVVAEFTLDPVGAEGLPSPV